MSTSRGRGELTPAVVVLAKRPEPGKVKTRLCPPFTTSQAAGLAAASLRDTLSAVIGMPAARRLLVFDGDPAGWLPSGWAHVPQVKGCLDRRIAAGLQADGGPSVLVGMDTPQLTAGHLADVNLSEFDACLGLAADGGFWALGLARPELAAEAVHDIPMSREDTGARQLLRLTELGLRVQLLPELTDVDTIDSAAAVAALAPATRFAKQFRSASATLSGHRR